MGFDAQVIAEAIEIIKQNGRKRRILFDNNLEKAKLNNPRLTEIENSLMQIGPQIGLATLSGDRDLVEKYKNLSTELSNEKKQILNQLNLSEYQPCCNLCGDSGRLQNGELCTCVFEQAKKITFNAMRENMPMDDSSFDNFDLNYYKRSNIDGAYETMCKTLTFCKKYAEQFEKGSENLLFMGGTGLGKTHLSLAIAQEVLNKGFGVYYAPAQVLVQKLESEHFSYGDDTPIFNHILGVDLLVIDDLGTEFSTAYTKSLIYNIINSRLLKNKPTVLSTNLSLEELEKQYSARITSRIVGNYNIRKFSGNDIRQMKRLDKVGVKNNGTEKN